MLKRKKTRMRQKANLCKEEDQLEEDLAEGIKPNSFLFSCEKGEKGSRRRLSLTNDDNRIPYSVSIAYHYLAENQMAKELAQIIPNTTIKKIQTMVHATLK
jgi:hypothetical protein